VRRIRLRRWVIVGLSVTGALGGIALASWMLRLGWLVGPNNLLYLSTLGALVGLLAGLRRGPTIARRLDGLAERVAAVPPDAVLAAGTGATVGLLITVLLNNVLAVVPGFTWLWSLAIAVTLVTASAWFLVVNRSLFGSARTPGVFDTQIGTVPDRGTPKLVDTSAIIDGRLVEVAEANFLDGRLLVPQFVLHELQRIADADDPLKRRRGRRGLEMLDRLVNQGRVPTEVIDDDPSAASVDDKLVKACVTRGADLVTTDYNLHRVAGLQGVRVLNLHQLANAVKAPHLPGERLSLDIAKEGREPGQGLAYLEDGTMVVVEGAAGRVGSTLDVVVTSSLQTQMGRMVFARLAEPARMQGPAGDEA
jgi:uncharacterized protein YacL